MPARTIQQMLPAMYYARSRGVVRAQDLLARGWAESDIRVGVRRDELRKVARGLYTSRRSPCTADRPTVAASVAIPTGVVCLLSALHLHGLVADRPADVWMALPEKAWRPRTDLPVRLAWFSGVALTEGIETRVLENVPVRLYSATKTVADCVKYRGKIGPDVAMVAFRELRRSRPEQIAELMRYGELLNLTKALRDMELVAA